MCEEDPYLLELIRNLALYAIFTVGYASVLWLLRAIMPAEMLLVWRIFHSKERKAQGTEIEKGCQK